MYICLSSKRSWKPLKDNIISTGQTKPLVEVYYKLADTVWRMSTYEGLDKLVRLDSIDVGLSMAEIYFYIDLPPDPDETTTNNYP